MQQFLFAKAKTGTKHIMQVKFKFHILLSNWAHYRFDIKIISFADLKLSVFKTDI
jgi:hypothetical protein